VKGEPVPVASALEASRPATGASASGTPPDPFDRIAEVILRIGPFSVRAFGIALAAMLLGGFLQTLVVLTAGTGRPFAGFFPAICVAAIVAGAPAGIAVCIISLAVLWWAVKEPHFTFHLLSVQDRSEMAWLLVCGLILVGFGLVCRKLLERAYKRQQAMNVLVRELEHRRANTFSVLRAITKRTLHHNPEAADQLLRRFEAIRRMNDLLTEQPNGALLTTIFRNELEGITSEQVIMHGADVMVPAEQARNLILIVHELVTNAVKYGALSIQTGRLQIDWTRNGNDLRILWHEAGVPAVSQPARKGFGTSLIEYCVASLRGSWEPSFAPDGFRCSLALPLAEPQSGHLQR
jgi:two-component sensor histidine kinase